MALELLMQYNVLASVATIYGAGGVVVVVVREIERQRCGYGGVSAGK